MQVKRKRPVHYFLTSKDVERFYTALRLGAYQEREEERVLVEEMLRTAAKAGVIK